MQTSTQSDASIVTLTVEAQYFVGFKRKAEEILRSGVGTLAIAVASKIVIEIHASRSIEC